MKLCLEKIKHRMGNSDFYYNAQISNGITGIFGYSGSGKTTLMNIICGIEPQKSGRTVFNDCILFDKEKKINTPVNKRNMGVVFQENYLFPHLNIRQNLLYSKPYIKNKKEVTTFDTVVKLLDIEELLAKKPFQLSGGERQRVAIGRSLLSQPQLLLMDEPFSNLDKMRRKQIISYLLKINHQFGIPALIISHDLEDILKLTSSLLIINGGKIEASGHYLEIAESKSAPGIISYKGYLNILELYHCKFIKDEYLHAFSIERGAFVKTFLKTNSPLFSDNLIEGGKARFCILPHDIVLNSEMAKNTSIQNQIKGIVRNLHCNENSCFVTIECGIKVVAEVTKTAVKKMNITVGKSIYCLIKAQAIEVIHVYKNGGEKNEINNN